MRVVESIEINRPVEEIFSYAADPNHFPEWSGIILEVQQEAPGSLREGDRFTTVSRFLGRRFETPFKVTAHEPNRQHSHRSTGGPLPQEYTSTFEETAGGGTRMTQVVEGEPVASSGWPGHSWRGWADDSSRPTWRRSRTFWKRRALHKDVPAEGGLP
jgi:uncharacterized protein YndB with AHSA1/START domain